MTRALPSRKVRCCLVACFVLGFASSMSLAENRHKGAAITSHKWKVVTSASWYGRKFSGRSTASGTNFNPQHLTAAHRTLRLGSRVRVTELRSGRSVVVQITDRGPYVHGRGLDLSYAAARQLGILERGVAKVEVELLKPQPLQTSPPIVIASSGSGVTWRPSALVE
ncbi:MAG: septal ring lytic transglycosylase RlpA family protein [Deltaproteobacteria bacterium]|nr:septal ring lytic transglycosylase RlpA family protein [Deltaproteobacteria bacterium]